MEQTNQQNRQPRQPRQPSRQPRQQQRRPRQKTKEFLTKGNKTIFTQYLKINSYNPITFIIAFTTAFLHSFLRSNLSAKWASGTMEADITLAVVAFFFWMSMMLNVQRMVYGTRVDQIIFLISATVGTVLGVHMFG
jgi:threonine/homoserine/homoserine lactone efflux protein